MIDFAAMLRTLAQAGVDYVLVGGAAAIVHGSARHTLDIDVVYARTPENIGRLVKALAPHRPYLRGAPPGLPFRWDRETIERGLNFTLTTTLGDIDLLGEVAGGGGYERIVRHSIRIQAFGITCSCVELDHLIHLKRAAGRPKDLDAIAELEAIRAEHVQDEDGHGRSID